ncbi:DEAD/DEAH box helicase [Enterococcus faecium]|uniref:DEAD/DEAH box helicase n=1 Tax=Enterococcus faecium TaxID=1352 RepID=UPI0010C1E86C|nr:DEAD/DEAH box helicase [Enterococcus faecium]TKQ55878.1 DEAD/DEAH box helicase [Enterococcus faecium]TKQ58078.1 DEAD/DEAH box helicase [Enterococcus faecium]TKQ59613.1 DEAD/DEAH box helicase [Enterococcus faecium]
MFEYGVPLEEHIQVEYMAQELIILAIATIGDASNFIWDNRNVGTSLSLNDELIENLNFTSIYFNSLITSKIGESNYNDYFGILGAISFYLSDSLGSTKVMLNKIDWSMDLEVNGIETVLLYLMADRLDDLNGYKFPSKYIYSFYSLIEEYSQFYSNGTLINIESLVILKQKIYESQNPREILFGDALLAVFIKKYKNASLNLLPNYSGTTIEDWNGLLLNNSSIKELWPSQILLGKESIFKGSSGVIQMPTSSGKTTSIGLIIRSAFITNRTKLAIVVAPFKALCKEITLNLTDFFSHDEVIVNELSDIAEKDDIDFFDTTEKNTLIILTPEKLLFLIRNKNEILEDLNLIIFDEAHLFDDNSRGTNYELLISTIKYYLKKSSQKILISAVITNSSMINDWLNDGDGKVISNNNIISAQRSIAMGDWIGHTEQLYFLNQENPDIDDFYVPKIVDIQEINKLGRERVKRYFPDVDFKKKKLNNAYDMQIYYALKMIHNGATAIFSGTKASADKTIERILEIERRGLPIAAFSNNNNADENIKIANLIKLNLGDSATYYYAALKGVFIHHGNIPSGIRTSIEYAMSHNLINFVVCTSTLAQGVNLPIKYLIISNLYQGQSQIKVRDFHNLLGRTGRAGKHIEGTVILSEPFVHSNKRDWKWRKYKSMLNIANSEDSLSNLLKLVRDIDIKNLPSINLLPLILLKYSNSDEFNRQNNLLKQVIKKEFPESYLPFSNELQTILNSLNDVENYVMFFMNYFGKDEANFTNIVTKQTLGYQLASEDEKEKLIHLFDTIKNHSLLLTKGELNLYTITSLGFDSSKFLSQWLSEKIEEINQVNSEIELVNIIFPQLVLLRENALVKKITDSSIFSKLCELWIQGESYREILIYCQNNHFTLIRYNKLASFTIQDVIEICDSILAYSTILPLNGIVAFMNDSQNNLNINLIKKLQKKIRYGLPNNLSINIYELGFSDRGVAQIIAKIIDKDSFFSSLPSISKQLTKRLIREKKDSIETVLKDFPQYFVDTLQKL